MEPGKGHEVMPETSQNRAANAGSGQSPVVDTRFVYREPLTDKYPHLARVSEELVRCIKCGMCRAVCPTLIETLSESQGARGRVSLVEAVFDGRLGLSDIFDDRVSTCLNCKACVQACPSGVRVDDIILAARAELVSRGRFPFVKRLLMRGLLKRGRLLPPVGRMASLFQRALLAVSPKGSALRLLLPAVRIDRERHLPVFAARSFIEQVPERTPPVLGEEGRGLRVAYFVGCSANLVYTNVGRSVVNVLSRLAVEVLVPKNQGCCGLPVFNAGDFVTARGMARKNVDILRELVRRERLDAVVVSCSSCGLALKREYSKILGVDSSGLSEHVMDVSEFIVKKVGLRRLEALLGESRS
ncbi:MAG: 4Fe-4S dicluster domain-containing protein, partial [Candidatus Eisenbacteria bacterium]|nr:4Fe-4S dicluster domain-containing protein [Candidatus Eisenbacteria bacterium]